MLGGAPGGAEQALNGHTGREQVHWLRLRDPIELETRQKRREKRQAAELPCSEPPLEAELVSGFAVVVVSARCHIHGADRRPFWSR